MSRLKILAGGLALSLLSPLLFCAVASASQETEYAEAVELYRSRHYKEAGDMFWKSITDGNRDVKPWLYSGNCLYAQGRYAEAVERFTTTARIYKGTPEATAAGEYVKNAEAKLKAAGPSSAANPVVSSPVASPVAANVVANPAAAGSAVGSSPAIAPGVVSNPANVAISRNAATFRKSIDPVSLAPTLGKFKDRIEIIRPAMGHPAVTQQTEGMIRASIKKIPPYLMSVLDQGDSKIFLTCSLVDKWPECLTAKHSYDDQTMSNDRGHTYGHDIWVCERPVNATTNLGEDAFPQADIEATFFNEVGHSLDDLMGHFSKNLDLRKAYGEDVGTLSTASNVSFFLQPGDAGPSETCAEIVSDLLGAHGSQTVQMKSFFPRSYAWVKTRLKF
jgi:hypothetical protein